ncbi:hypothetical protein [Mycolicibacterium insubricum]|uniref:hypothetical protein n=1 Tax=Mycolicibacterium insubricum TaxID=444597 RepID=UPI001056DC1C|nr:hypothetical protein [Mycolicibacterium insubricum]MCV7080132.1 hypothetical protein [Mycolicibacterium insubricum]
MEEKKKRMLTVSAARRLITEIPEIRHLLALNVAHRLALATAQGRTLRPEVAARQAAGTTGTAAAASFLASQALAEARYRGYIAAPEADANQSPTVTSTNARLRREYAGQLW